MITTIFCPACDALILDAVRCPACGKWERPPAPPAGRGALAWHAVLATGLASSLTLADDVLYACDTDGKLHALSAATGAPRWAQPADLGAWRPYRQVAVAAGKVIIGPDDSRSIPQADKAVLALDITSGATLWRSPLSTRWVSDPTVAGDTVFVMTSDGHAAALALADGALRWHVPIRSAGRAAPAVARDLVVFGGDKGTLAALAAASGAEAWTFDAEPDPQWGASFPYRVVFSESRLYVTCWNRRCYALDAATGSVLWASDHTKRPPLTPPTVHESGLYFCGHDRYVYCLDTSDGRLRWRTQLPRRSVTTPVVIAGRVYVASQDHHLYALDPITGEAEAAGRPIAERRTEADWASDGLHVYLGDVEGQIYAIVLSAPEPPASPETLASQGSWAEAAPRYALAGNLCRAAEIYAAELAEPIHAARLYERAGEAALAAEHFDRGGEFRSARSLYVSIGRHEHVARLSEAMDDLPAAAQAYEQAGRWEQAASVYARLGATALPQAAHAFERAAEAASGQGAEKAALALWLQAAEAYHRLRQPEKAVQLFHRAGERERADYVIREERDPALKVLLMRLVAGPEELARLFSEQGQHAAAAEEYIRLKRPIEAARSYERAKEYVLAAEQYRTSEQWGDAGRMMEAAHVLGEAAALFLKAGDRSQAAAVYARQARWPEAARLHEELNAWSAAANAWTAAGELDRAAEAWERAGEFVQAAAVWQKLGACDRAAEGYWQAAQAAQAQKTQREQVAALYDLALRSFEECGKAERAKECDAVRRYLRRQPLLELELSLAGGFTEGHSGKLILTVRNNGWGQAANIVFEVKGSFETDLEMAAEPFGLAADVTREVPLYVVPKRAGSALPLYLAATYTDARGRPLPALKRTFDISVRSKEERRGDSTPQNVFYGPAQLIQSDQVGDVVGGDQVKIQRQGAGTTPAATPASPASAPAPRLTCPACANEQPADLAKCSNPACGRPFFRCAACGFYQPERGRFCMHCQATQT